MPLVAHNALPAFSRLQGEGIRILAPDTALQQDIRELHIGLLNMMPDAALEATERQFMRLIGRSNPIAQFYLHPFTLETLPRGEKGHQHIDRYYQSFSEIRHQGLDGLIITGANVEGSNLAVQPFWEPLKEIFSWAEKHVTSTLCSCLATHAVMQFKYGEVRTAQPQKRWGVFPHTVRDRQHPLLNGVNSHFNVPHSRWNDISKTQFQNAGTRILVDGGENLVHLATSEDGFRTVMFQGHPEYDAISLLKEYKRDLMIFQQGQLSEPPPFPDNYFTPYAKAIFGEYLFRNRERESFTSLPPLPFPEKMVSQYIDNTWMDSAGVIIGNWMGLIYQTTHSDRHIPLMNGLSINDPLHLNDR